MTDTIMKPSVEKLRKASKAVYLAVEENVAKDISELMTWGADEIERLNQRIVPDGHIALPKSREEAQLTMVVCEAYLKAR